MPVNPATVIRCGNRPGPRVNEGLARGAHLLGVLAICNASPELSGDFSGRYVLTPLGGNTPASNTRWPDGHPGCLVRSSVFDPLTRDFAIREPLIRLDDERTDPPASVFKQEGANGAEPSIMCRMICVCPHDRVL